jgi:hypothetical protein
MWCSLLSGTDLSAIQSPADIDEKIFTLRPYVFACAKYDITYAPWHHRRLPLADPGVHPITTPSSEGDITVRSKAVPYGRFGYTWRRAPPHFVLGAYLVFFRLLERQPSPTQAGVISNDKARQGLFSVSRILPSVYHDREWQRNSVCQDPNTSPGLPPLTFMGDLNGYWRGTFLFYDFEMYRQIIAGDMRAVYTGQFSAQNVEMQLKETVIKIRKDQIGGEGPLLLAGFNEVGEEQGEREQQRIEAGYGHELAQTDEADQEGYTKEILISGRVSYSLPVRSVTNVQCRSDWGWAMVRGRIRAWDGLVILALEYPQHAMSKWLWRGYLHTGGHLLGRWRDSVTDEHLRGKSYAVLYTTELTGPGYEGAFGMVRAGDISWPPHLSMSGDAANQ